MHYPQVIKNEVKEIIINSIPAFKNILSERDWKIVINNYLKRVDDIPSDSNDVINSSCLIDLIICSLNETDTAKGNKETINAINVEINKALAYCNKHSYLLNKVNNLIRKSITEMDIDVTSPNSAFKNWVNELFVFNLLAEWDGYEIVDIERPLGNGKSCDFVCRNCNSEEIWFEVLTIQRLSPSKQDKSATMNEFINNRIMTKFQEKTKGITNGNIPNIKILPVIEYIDGLERFNILLNSDIAIEPLAIMKNNLNGVIYIEIRPLSSYLSQIRKQQEKV